MLLMVLFQLLIASFASAATGKTGDILGQAWVGTSNPQKVDFQNSFGCCGWTQFNVTAGYPCPPVTLCANYTKPGYISNCGTPGVLEGASCNVTCAPGYTGKAVSTLGCLTGGVLNNGSFTGCNANCAKAYNQTGYVINGCSGGDSAAIHNAKCQAVCAPGYTGTPTGEVSCQNGQYSGSFSGCYASCNGPYTQEGYAVSACDGPQNHGDNCIAQCASSYSGTATGTVSCTNGFYTGVYTGCRQAAQSVTAVLQGLEFVDLNTFRAGYVANLAASDAGNCNVNRLVLQVNVDQGTAIIAVRPSADVTQPGPRTVAPKIQTALQAAPESNNNIQGFLRDQGVTVTSVGAPASDYVNVCTNGQGQVSYVIGSQSCPVGCSTTYSQVGYVVGNCKQGSTLDGTKCVAQCDTQAGFYASAPVAQTVTCTNGQYIGKFSFCTAATSAPSLAPTPIPTRDPNVPTPAPTVPPLNANMGCYYRMIGQFKTNIKKVASVALVIFFSELFGMLLAFLAWRKLRGGGISLPKKYGGSSSSQAAL